MINKDKPRILIVDDEPGYLELLEAYLVRAGYGVVSASKGEEALGRISAGGIDLVLLDAMMPGLDGFEVVRRIRGGEATRMLPVVLVTALSDVDDRIKGAEAGCDDFLSKPLDSNELLARVRTLLKLSHFRSLLDEKEKFEAVADHMSEGLVVLDTGLTIRRFNQKARDWLMIPEDSGRRPVPFVPGVCRRFTIHYSGDLNRGLLEKDLSWELERPETKAERPLFLATRSSIIQNRLGETTSVVLVIRDVTEVRRKEFVERSLLELTSHKLRTSMTLIKEYASSLQEQCLGPLNREQKEAVDGILRRSGELLESFNKQLELLEIRSLKTISFDDEIELEQYLKDERPSLLADLEKRFPGRKVECQVTYPEAKGRRFALSKAYLDLVLKNLTENAVRFNENEPVRIRISLKNAPQKIELSISDNGSGIPPEEKEKIFEPFYQVDKHRTGNVQGVGLGLALVKQLVSVYEGRIEVESEIGKGSTFTLIFPVHAVSGAASGG